MIFISTYKKNNRKQKTSDGYGIVVPGSNRVKNKAKIKQKLHKLRLEVNSANNNANFFVKANEFFRGKKTLFELYSSVNHFLLGRTTVLGGLS